MSLLALNLGLGDRQLRIVLGLALLGWMVVGDPAAWWGWLGLVPLVTGIAGICPFYAMWDVSTRHDGDVRAAS